MKNYQLSGDYHLSNELQQVITNYLGITFNSDGCQLILKQTSGKLLVTQTQEETMICFEKIPHLLRGLTYLAKSNNESLSIKEDIFFDSIGPMFDVSRNAVLKPAKVKELMTTSAFIGLDNCMLYMEDTYTIPDYPYFGYLRGQYTQAELKDLDAFANVLGVELIPSIQVLGHLRNPLKWNFANGMKDTEDILLVGADKTYEFLESAIKSVMSCFTTKKLHIGMDEAHTLGLGNYLKKNGFQNRFEIMNEHLTRVKAITDELGLDLQMWSDMFFRIGSKTGDYYDKEAVIPEEIIANIPDVSLVYWDYYNHKTEDYQQLIKTHRTLQKPIIFAGGIWTWNGIAPNYSKSIDTTNKGLAVCKEQGIKTVYATLWQDDGAETPIDTILLGLQLFAEHQFNQTVSQNALAEQFSLMQNQNSEDFLLLDLFDNTPGVAEYNAEASAASKLILYQDLFSGMYDLNLNEWPLKAHYEQLVKTFDNVTSQASIFEFYKILANICYQKVDLGIKIRTAYQTKDHSLMTEAVHTIEELHQLISQLATTHQDIWYSQNKFFGWEVLDIRYGGLLQRLTTNKNQLSLWLNDTSHPIDELEIDLLPFDGPYPMKKGAIIGRNLYQFIVSPGKLSDV
ncbi:family 20 glycosylhydrolase [Vagococcus zengguangii]|uniref:Beta-N-acetylhexosaminidase n=1 Tax=Vagococcus zengguangii TaxID=2571750 RepID=A0A4D7CST1_9ENTE|nr:beta-N-acetylhexosaminidase [Vagococcus zengguangii]QCI86183.1 beta-N-acetylhexosaminidase [Vagococcus zengguangii]